MSVHGEYSRALESFVARVRCLPREQREGWLAGLEDARVDRNPDLTRAATRCREVLETMARTLRLAAPDAQGDEADALREPYKHLLAHCLIVLGVPS